MATKYLVEASFHIILSEGVSLLRRLPMHMRQEVEYTFKVHGENLVVAIIAGSTHVDRIAHTIATTVLATSGGTGPYHKATPLILYESFAEDSLGVTEDMVQKKGTTPAFDPEKDIFWVVFNYEGHPLNDLLEARRRETVAALEFVHGGEVPIMLFKTVFKNQIHMFVQMDGAALDKLSLFRTMRDQVKITIRAVKIVNDEYF